MREKLKTLDEVIEEYIESVLEMTGYNIRQTAKILGVSKGRLYRTYKKPRPQVVKKKMVATPATIQKYPDEFISQKGLQNLFQSGHTKLPVGAGRT